MQEREIDIESIEQFARHLQYSGFTNITHSTNAKERWDLMAEWHGDRYLFELKERSVIEGFYDDLIIDTDKVLAVSGKCSENGCKQAYIVTIYPKSECFYIHRLEDYTDERYHECNVSTLYHPEKGKTNKLMTHYEYNKGKRFPIRYKKENYGNKQKKD